MVIPGLVRYSEAPPDRYRTDRGRVERDRAVFDPSSRVLYRKFSSRSAAIVFRADLAWIWRELHRLEQELKDATRQVHPQLAKVALAAADCR